VWEHYGEKGFSAAGVKVDQVEGDYGSDPAVSARATKSIETITGYTVTTTPITRKIINGAEGPTKIDGKPKKTFTSTKPETGDQWRK
jgi:hypothetical protein